MKLEEVDFAVKEALKDCDGRENARQGNTKIKTAFCNKIRPYCPFRGESVMFEGELRVYCSYNR